MLKPTIISIAMATVMAGAAISPALGLIADHFSQADPVLIKLVLTAPSLTIIPFSFLSSFLAKKISKRAIIVIGITIYIIAGVGAQFSGDIWVLLILRFILGAGVGVVMPLSFAIISDYFDGAKRAKMMGYNSAFSNVGGIVTMLLAGYLAQISWRAPFDVYAIGLIILALVLLYLPKNKPLKVDKTVAKEKVPLYVYGYALAGCGIMLAYIAIATNMALFLEQSQMGGSKIAGYVIAFSTVGGLTTSMILVRLQRVLKSRLMMVSLLSMGLGFTLIATSHVIPVVMVGVCMVGFAQGTTFPLINIKVLADIPTSIGDKAISIISSMIFVGQFISPIVLDSIGSIVGRTTIRFQYSLLAGSLFLAVLVMIIVKFSQRKGKEKERVTSHIA